ncbi:MAG: sodium:solute symporter family protein [Cyanobacteria bacterium J06626_6]
MQTIDWLIVIGYLVLVLILGIYLSRRSFQNLVDFFASGRSLPWWLAGTSMAATTLSVDTPLYIAGVVGNRGIAGNWEWWSFGFAHVVMVYIFARLWRRSEIVTDAEFCELRYGGSTAAVLRGVKAFLFAVPINCLGIGYAMLAMAKVLEVLSFWQLFGLDPATDNLRLWSVIVLSALVIVYAGFSSLWNVVATDLFQFVLALLGSWVVAIASVNAVGGMRPLVEYFSLSDPDVLSVLPMGWGGGFSWRAIASIPSSTFLAYGFLQWWAYRRSDGGGEFIQRLAASQSEADAEKAAWLFNALHYGVRTWPWIITALAALIIYPDLPDRELGYPLLIVNYLPPVILGLVVTSLIAAFMSTASTLINWGSSYLTNDLYGRFLSTNAGTGELLFAGRLSSIIIAVTGGVAAFISDDIGTLFRLVIAIGTGPGLVLILRWFWWRINAAAELAAIISGFLVGFIVSAGPGSETLTFGQKLLLITALTTLIWVSTMLLTPPESVATLDRFYAKVRPGGPGWDGPQHRTGLPPQQNLTLDIQKTLAAGLLLFGSMFTVGGFLLFQSSTGWLALLMAVGGGTWLKQLNKQPTFPAPRPGIEDG